MTSIGMENTVAVGMSLNELWIFITLPLSLLVFSMYTLKQAEDEIFWPRIAELRKQESSLFLPK